MYKRKTGQPTLLKNLNKQVVFNIIRTKKLISRVHISRISNLKPPTVSNIINELLSENFIIYAGKGKSNKNGGPKPDLYKLNPEGRFFIGLDINAENIIGVLLNLEGKNILTIQKKYNYKTKELLTKDLILLIKELITKSNVDKNLIEGIGVGIAGFVNTENGIITISNISVLNDYHIKNILEEEFNMIVKIDKDVNLIAFGNNWFYNKNKRLNNILCIGIRAGIGLGIILNGEIYRGNKGFAGNLGHSPLINNKKQCDCGITGCLETIAGENALIKNVKQYAKQNKNSLNNELSVLKVKNIEEININKIYEALKNNNSTIINILKDTFYFLGAFIGNIVQLLEPHVIIICGEIFNYNNILYNYLLNITKDYCWGNVFDNTVFLNLPIDYTTIAHSAATLILKDFFYPLNLNS